MEEVASLKLLIGDMRGEQQERRALEERARELVSVAEQEKTRRLEAEARLKVVLEGENAPQEEKESPAMHPATDSRVGKEATADAIDLQVTVGRGPGLARPTLFDIANMDQPIA